VVPGGGETHISPPKDIADHSGDEPRVHEADQSGAGGEAGVAEAVFVVFWWCGDGEVSGVVVLMGGRAGGGGGGGGGTVVFLEGWVEV